MQTNYTNRLQREAANYGPSKKEEGKEIEVVLRWVKKIDKPIPTPYYGPYRLPYSGGGYLYYESYQYDESIEWLEEKESLPQEASKGELAEGKKSANEVLFEHGINTMNLNDDFNSQLFHAMERYAEQFKTVQPVVSEEAISRLFDNRFDCYADVANDEGGATVMTKERFIEVVSQLGSQSKTNLLTEDVLNEVISYMVKEGMRPTGNWNDGYNYAIKVLKIHFHAATRNFKLSSPIMDNKMAESIWDAAVRYQDDLGMMGQNKYPNKETFLTSLNLK